MIYFSFIGANLNFKELGHQTVLNFQVITFFKLVRLLADF